MAQQEAVVREEEGKVEEQAGGSGKVNEGCEGELEDGSSSSSNFSSSWDDADFDVALEEDQKVEGRGGGGGEQVVENQSDVKEQAEEALRSCLRRRVRAWKAEFQVLEGAELFEPQGGSLETGSAVESASEEDARWKAQQQQKQQQQDLGYPSSEGDGGGEQLDTSPRSHGVDVEVEESACDGQGSSASSLFQGSVDRGRKPSEDNSRHARLGSLWPSGLESDEDEEVVSERKRPHAGDQDDGEEEQPVARRRRLKRLDVEEVEEGEIGGGEICAFKEVYRMPAADDMPSGSGDGQGQMLLLPAAFIINAIGFQVKLIGKAFNVFLWFLNIFCMMFWAPVAKTLEATGLITQSVSYVSQLPPRIAQGASHAGPKVGQLWKKMGLGCLAATYVVIVLIALLIPAVVLDYVVLSRFVEKPLEIKEPLHFDYTQPKPSAVVNLLAPAVMVRAKNYAAAHPDKIVKTRAILVGHKFHVTVVLTLPESDYNRQLGMFQISVELLSIRGYVLARASRPCMLQFRSGLLRHAKTFLLGLPLLLGLCQEYQTMAVRVLDRHYEKVIPTASVTTVLEPKAGFPVGQGLPELYKAEVRIQSQLPWLKSLVYNWRWTFYVWGAFWLFLLEVGLVLLCCRQALVPTSWRSFTDDVGEGSQSGYRSPESRKPSGAGDHGVGKKSGRSKRRVSFQDEIPTAEVLLGTDSATPAAGQPSAEEEFPAGLPMPPMEDVPESGEDEVPAVEEIVAVVLEKLADVDQVYVLQTADEDGKTPP